jgi:cytochrome P450
MRALSDVPALPSTGLLSGNANEFRRERGDFFVRMHDTVGDVGVLRIFRFPVLSIVSPELLHEVFVEKARSFEKTLALRIAFYPLAGNGLFTAEGELWRAQRRRMAPLFHPTAVRGYGDAMSEVVDRCLSTWRDGQVIDAGKEMTKITMAVVGKVLFGVDTLDETDEMGAAITVMFNYLADEGGSFSLTSRTALLGALQGIPSLPPWADRARDRFREFVMSPHRWPLPGMRKLASAIDTLDRHIAGMIDERRRSQVQKDDVLSRILSAQDEDGSRMTDRQARDEAVTLFVAGHETTATSTTWSLYFLSRNPDVYRRHKAEVARLEGSLSADDAPRLPYTIGVFKEALRLYPPAFVLDRISVEDVTLGDIHVPKQTTLLISPYALHRRPSLWPDPLRFEPDRYLPEAEAQRPRMAWLPFGAGPRVCIGAQFATQEAMLVLARIAQRFHLEAVDKEPIGPSYSTALRPERPVMLRVHKA